MFHPGCESACDRGGGEDDKEDEIGKDLKEEVIEGEAGEVDKS